MKVFSARPRYLKLGPVLLPIYLNAALHAQTQSQVANSADLNKLGEAMEPMKGILKFQNDWASIGLCEKQMGVDTECSTPRLGAKHHWCCE